MRSEHNRVARAAAAGAVALLLAAGCGGGDEATEATEAHSVQNEYVEDVRTAVGPVATQSQRLITQVDEARSIDDLAAPLEEAEKGYRMAARELEAITPPEEVAELHQRLVESQQQIAEATRQAERAAEENNPDGLDEFSEAGDLYAERSRVLSERFSELGYEL